MPAAVTATAAARSLLMPAPIDATNAKTTMAEPPPPAPAANPEAMAITPRSTGSAQAGYRAAAAGDASSTVQASSARPSTA